LTGCSIEEGIFSAMVARRAANLGGKILHFLRIGEGRRGPETGDKNSWSSELHDVASFL